jgi:hypothetical protein
MSLFQMFPVFGLTAGEAFIVGFLTFFIVSAPHWPRVGAWLGRRVDRGRNLPPPTQ